MSLDIIGGERSQALYGIQSVSEGGESGLCGTETPHSQTANELGEQFAILTPVEAEPEDSFVSDKQQQEDPYSSGVELLHKR